MLDYINIMPSLHVSAESWEVSKCTINGPLYTVYAIHHRTPLRTHTVYTHYMYTVSVDGRHPVSGTSCITCKHILSHIFDIIWVCEHISFVGMGALSVLVCLCMCVFCANRHVLQCTHSAHTHTHKPCILARAYTHVHMYKLMEVIIKIIL